MSAAEPGYTLLTELRGSSGPLNCLLFSPDGKFLLSGGDDEYVRVYNTYDYKLEQELCDRRWGQITSLVWVSVQPPIAPKRTSLSIGTGRGLVALCPTPTDIVRFSSNPKTFVTTAPFQDDPVEGQAYDALNARLAICSHSGLIKLFKVEKCTVLVPIWKTNISNAIPRCLNFFGGANQNLLVHGLETGEMCCIEAQTSKLEWTKGLKAGIGYAALSQRETMLLVNNLNTGVFDLYDFPHTSPSTSFPVGSKRRLVKQCLFAEMESKVAVCGSDDGHVYIFDIDTGKRLQKLQQADDNTPIQCLASVTTADGYLMASGTTSSDSKISLWKKVIEDKNTDTSRHGGISQNTLNFLFCLLLLLLSYPQWSGWFHERFSSAGSSAGFSGADFSGARFDSADWLGDVVDEL